MSKIHKRNALMLNTEWHSWSPEVFAAVLVAAPFQMNLYVIAQRLGIPDVL